MFTKEDVNSYAQRFIEYNILFPNMEPTDVDDFLEEIFMRENNKMPPAGLCHLVRAEILTLTSQDSKGVLSNRLY